MPEVAFLGDKDIIEGFSALGAAVFPVSDKETLEKAFQGLRKGDYKVLFITEGWAQEASEELERIAHKGVFPIVVVIPDTKEKKGVAEARLRKIMKMAIGRDTLFET